MLGATGVPRLASWLAHAKRGTDEHGFEAAHGCVHRAWLWRAFAGEDSPPVTAPYAWRALNHATAITLPDESQWWQIDPIHIVLARDHLRIGAGDDADMSGIEADALAIEADDVLREYGAHLKYLRHDAWFLQTDEPWQLATVPLDAARGQSLADCLPTGPDAARWRKILTEIQMRWHHLPLNEAREAQRRPTINGVWLHGGGIWRPLQRAPFATIASDDATLRGWALAAGLAPAALVADNELPRHTGGDAVSLWTGLLEPARLEAWGLWLERLAAFETWLAELLTCAFGAGLGVELVLCGDQTARTFSLRKNDALRFWRRATLADLLEETVA